VRLLVLYQARDVATDQPGYYQGFEHLVSEGLLDAHAAIPLYGVAERQGWDGLWAEAEQTARTMRADAVFLQFFHGAIPDPTEGIQRLQRLPSKPTLFTSLGDPYGRWTKRVPRSFRIASALADISFLTGMGYIAKQLEHWGSRNLVLMPHGCCQVRFSSPQPMTVREPEFDVAFVGSRIRSQNPASHFFWVARRRVEFVAACTKRFGKRFGLFGKGWEGNSSWQDLIPFARQHEAYQRAAVVLGGTPNADHDYYTSDRPFIAIASGVPLVDYAVRGVERILEPGVDWWLADSLSGLLQRCDKLLELPLSERTQLGQNARERVLASHTQYHRCREMVEIVRALRDARMAEKRPSAPELSFLAPHRNEEQDLPAAVVAWQG
jgi:glycosyltransferase involved in cell wall biosynthesis